jgi:prepilin-type N-terminal cleavage/methylation domain-containing protein
MRRAYTLIEVLMVVTVLGIAATMVVPAFSQTNTLRLQGAVRMIVADITQAQSDAVALQNGQTITFTSTGYTIAPLAGDSIDTAADVIVTRSIGGDEFGGAELRNISLADGVLTFDAMGGPVAEPGSDVAAGTGTIDVVASGQTYRITIEAFTGRVTVTAIANDREDANDAG